MWDDTNSRPSDSRVPVHQRLGGNRPKLENKTHTDASVVQRNSRNNKKKHVSNKEKLMR